MDNIGIVVESHNEVISFFTELGLKLEGGATVELSRFLSPLTAAVQGFVPICQKNAKMLYALIKSLL